MATRMARTSPSTHNARGEFRFHECASERPAVLPSVRSHPQPLLARAAAFYPPFVGVR